MLHIEIFNSTSNLTQNVLEGIYKEITYIKTNMERKQEWGNTSVNKKIVEWTEKTAIELKIQIYSLQ